MCGPMVIPAVAIVSAAFSANQQIQQGKYQKGVADYNAAVAENESQEAQNRSVERENMQRRRTAELLAKQRAQLGAANVDLTSGSALQLQEDTIALGEADALRIRSNYDSEVASLQTQSDLTRNQGDFAESAGQTSAAGTLLKGASATLGTGVADKWLKPNSAALTLNGQSGAGV